MAVLFGAVALAGAFGGGWHALGVFLALGLGIFVGVYMKSEPKQREPAVWERRPHPGPRRLLVVANETVAGRALRSEIGHRAQGGKAEVLVICPALNSPVKYWTSDEDDARTEAEARLNTSLAALAEDGIRAKGQIGDSDPLQAVEDGLRSFGADEVIVSTHPPGRSNWLERGVIAASRERFDVPVAHVVVDLEHERQTAESLSDRL